MFTFKATAEGGIDTGSDFMRAKFRDWLKKNAGQRIQIDAVLPESPKQRRWYHGALIPLACYYQDNFDYRDHTDRKRMHEWLKHEFNAEIVIVRDKAHKVAKTTKGELNKGYIERVMDWMGENGADLTILDPKLYKHCRDAVFPYTNYDTFIDYLIDIGRLPPKV